MIEEKINLQKLREKYEQLKKELTKKYGNFYPNNCDKKGWKLIGKLEMLAWILEKVTENERRKIDLQKLREKWFKKTHKVKGQPKIWMWEDDWNKMIDEYEEMVDVEQIKGNLEKKFQCNRNCSPDWEIFWKRLSE